MAVAESLLGVVSINATYAVEGLGEASLPEIDISPPACAAMPRRRAGKESHGGPGTLWVSLQTSRLARDRVLVYI